MFVTLNFQIEVTTEPNPTSVEALRPRRARAFNMGTRGNHVGGFTDWHELSDQEREFLAKHLAEFTGKWTAGVRDIFLTRVAKSDALKHHPLEF